MAIIWDNVVCHDETVYDTMDPQSYNVALNDWKQLFTKMLRVTLRVFMFSVMLIQKDLRIKSMAISVGTILFSNMDKSTEPNHSIV